MVDTRYKSMFYLTSIIQHLMMNAMTSISGDIIGDINDIKIDMKKKKLVFSVTLRYV